MESNRQSAFCAVLVPISRPEQRSRYSNSLRARRSGNRIPTGGRRGREFPHQSSRALGPTQPPIQWLLGLFLGVKRPRRGVTTHPIWRQGYRKSRAKHLLPVWAFMVCSRVTFTLPFLPGSSKSSKSTNKKFALYLRVPFRASEGRLEVSGECLDFPCWFLPPESDFPWSHCRVRACKKSVTQHRIFYEQAVSAFCSGSSRFTAQECRKLLLERRVNR